MRRFKMKKKNILFTMGLIGGLSFMLSSCLFQHKTYEPGDTSKINNIVSVEESGPGKALKTQGGTTLPSKGNPNILVVPVQFKGETEFSNNNLYNIKETFFGSSDDLVWESVSSFYEKSSYGKLNIGGMVTDVVTTQYSYSYYKQIINSSDSSSNSGISSVMTNIIDTVYSSLADTYGRQYLMSNFDSNKDNILDGVWMVYNIEEDETSKNDLLWAFTSWNTTSSAPISVYCWASYGFMQKDARLKKKDAHTFIHETGHMLGLEDYYDTGYSLSPFGGLGMMDYNILDLDVYSKWALGWIDPKAITNSTKLTNKGLTVTLKPFESSGDALVVGLPNNNGWYGEEYIILEYYTPTGLNERDSQYAYGSYSPLSGSSYPKGFTQPGIIAYHVDSRYGIFTASSKGYSLSSYVLTENALMNPKINPRTQFINSLFTNESDNSGKHDCYLISIYDASNGYGNLGAKTSILGGQSVTPANNNYLYQEGDTLKPDTLTKYQPVHQDGKQFGVELSFGVQDSESASVSITLA